MDQQDYYQNAVNEQVEVLSLVGNIAEHQGEPKVHAHVVLGKKDATAVGGHLLKAHVRPTLEVVLTESPVHLHRKHDDRTGLPLIRPQAEGLPPRRGRSPHAGVQADTNAANGPSSDDPQPAKQGVGQGMGYSIDKPQDASDWQQCPDCKVWVHGLDRTACPYCGFVLDKQHSGR